MGAEVYLNQETYEWEPVEGTANPNTKGAKSELAPKITWPVYGMKHAYADKPDREYIVDGLFCIPSVSILYGIPGSMKSLVMMDMAACVAGGTKWLQQPDGTGGMDVKQVPVIWCDFDMGAYDTEERLAAIGRAYNLPEDTPIYYVTMPDPWLDATNYESQSFVQLRLLAAEVGAKLIIIDNLAVISGSADENSADMKNVLSSFRRLAERGGLAVILIHHPRKSRGYEGNTGDSLRGHSSILAALNVSIEVEREQYSDTIRLKPQKSRGSDISPFGARFDYHHKEANNDLYMARFFGYDIPDVTSNTAIGEAIIEVVEETPGINKTAITDAVKKELTSVGVNRIRDQIQYLVKSNRLIERDGNRTTKAYFLPDL